MTSVQTTRIPSPLLSTPNADALFSLLCPPCFADRRHHRLRSRDQQQQSESTTASISDIIRGRSSDSRNPSAQSSRRRSAALAEAQE